MHERALYLELLWNLIPISIWKYRLYFVKFLLVFDCKLMLELLFIIDILIGLNHVSMVICCPSNGLCWRFPAIFTQTIISCEPALH